MGGAGPYVKFSPKVNVRRKQEGGSSSSSSNAEEVYERAKPYIMRWKEELLSEHNYQEELTTSNEENLLMAVSNPHRYSYVPAGQRRLFKLPSHVQAFACSSPPWEASVFSSLVASRSNRLSSDLFLDEAPPLQNIFYLLQTIFDGMLSLVREDDIDDFGEQTTTRVLPRKEWIQLNSDIVKEILGLSSTHDLEEDAQKHGFIIQLNRYDYDNYWVEEEEEEEPDYTACSIECGYCGKCDY